jgi:hypothetical protein
MKRALGLSWAWMIASGVLITGCAGPTGPAGKQGEQGEQGTPGTPGTPGTATPSVSAVTPAYAYLGRTVDLTIAGSGTSWSSSTTVAFADPGITVNKVTAASAAGLLVNVTIGVTSMIAATDVTVTDGSTKETYNGAFEVKAPLLVSLDQTAGVPQGGFANVDVQMLDITTPYDPNNLNATLSVTDVTIEGAPTANSDYDMGFFIAADVLSTGGESVDVAVQSGATGSMIDSTQKAAFKVVARTPTALVAGTQASGMISTSSDSVLDQITPADASQRFVQFTIASVSGYVAGYAIPKDGKYADALATGFAIRYGEGTTATDPIYLVVGDGTDPNSGGAGATPADVEVTPFESTCTAVSETAETATMNNDTWQTAQAVATLPALVNGTLGYGANPPADPLDDVDTYKITVPAGKTSIHAITGGDPLDDTVIDILDSTGNSVNGPSADDDYQEDYTVTGLTAGTYYVQVSASQQGFFNPADNTYQLFIAVE